MELFNERAASSSNLYRNLESIRVKINNTKKEISAANAGGAVLDAKQALDQVVSSTEKAADSILDIAEDIQKVAANIESESEKEKLDKYTQKIFEECNFQDLTGQLLQKVIVTLQFIEDVVGDTLDNIDIDNSSQSEDEHLMNGPALKNESSQDDIDKMFDWYE